MVGTDLRLALVLEAISKVLLTNSPQGLNDIMHQDITWHGLYQGQVCHGRDEAIDLIARHLQDEPISINELECIVTFEKVIVGISGSGFNPLNENANIGKKLYYSFVFEDHKVLEWKVFANREDALENIS